MTSFNSVSDLARSYQLRMSQSALRSKLNTLTAEVSSGVKQDISKSLRGDLSHITQVENRLALLTTYGQNIAEAQSLLEAVQNAMANIQSIAASVGTHLLSDALVSSEATLDIYLKKSPADLHAALGALNTSVGGRFVFSGAASDTPAVGTGAEMIAQLSAAVADAEDITSITDAISGYFDAPVGAGGFADFYLGRSGESTSIAVSGEHSVPLDYTALSESFKSTLKGLAILSYTSDRTDLSYDTRRELARTAGELLVSGETALTSAMTIVGSRQESVEKALNRNHEEITKFLSIKNSMNSSDPYESAIALQEIEANIETLYAVTARLSKLSIVEYL
ncbi:flagellar hook protein [Paracoccus ravus]|uniref:flagellar hook protein n=1 Tax=Paracoccus ravus TaxID=2447760 RepID=UPI00106EC939|nr:flagellar hook protein [Paracoccus ravus]